MRRFAIALVAVLLTGGVATALADPPAAGEVKALALRWYTQMQVGQLDRSQLAPAYSAQLTGDAVRENYAGGDQSALRQNWLRRCQALDHRGVGPADSGCVENIGVLANKN